MKISKLELITILLCAMFVAFAAGWFLRGGTAQPIRVEVGRPVQAAVTVPPLPAATVPPVPPPPAGTAKININTADASELQQLPGIGEKRAADIVAWRVENGPFRIPEDITKVKGIGEGTLADIIDYITVGEVS